MLGMLDWFGSWICDAFYSNATMVGVKEDYIRYAQIVSLLSWKCGSKWMWFSCLINLRPCWCLMYAINHALHWFWSEAFILFCPSQFIFQYIIIVLFFSACYQKLMVWMIFQYLSYICTLEGDAYGTNFPLLYFVINIFMMKIDAYGEFISSVATHGHYASVDCKKEPDHVKPSTRRSQVQ